MTVVYDGWAEFAILHDDKPIIHSAVAWTRKAEKNAWNVLKDIHSWGHLDEKIQSEVLHKPEMPPSLPWVGVILLPAFFKMKSSEILWAGDFERCMAWAIINANKTKKKCQHFAKFLKLSGEVIDIQPKNKTDFSLLELQQFVGGPIEVIMPPGKDGAIMVINATGKRGPILPKNALASRIWQAGSHPKSQRGLDDIVGNAVFCHKSQVL
jgi:hypothetical protein